MYQVNLRQGVRKVLARCSHTQASYLCLLTPCQQYGKDERRSCLAATPSGFA